MSPSDQETDDTDLSTGLAQLLGSRVEHLTRLTGGASRETWSFDSGGRPLILRIDPPAAPKRQSRLEAACLRAAATAGVSVPAVIAVDDDPAALGASYMILERIAGETIPRKILRDDGLARAREVLVGQAVDQLARIHRIDLVSVPDLDDTDQLSSWSEVLHALPSAHPALEIGLAFLAANRPEPCEPVLVHGDFRLGNLIVGPDGLRSVLDWELAHVGDPIEDLGWMCVRAWRFRSPHPGLGLGSYEELLDSYEQATGRSVSKADLLWWELFGTWRWGIICSGMAEGARAADHLSVELAAVGRRTCENEWDVLSCLERCGMAGLDLDSRHPSGDHLDDGPGTAPPPSLHDPPSLVEIVAAVRRLLVDSLQPALHGSLAFEARIAARLLATAEREITIGPPRDATHRALLAGLGVRSDVELATGISSGAIAYDDPAVLEAVCWSVRAKLAVAHPGYEDE